MSRPAWFPDWSGQTAVLVAGGPSAKGADLSSVKDRARFIAVNDSWVLCPWADVLYACDESWWTFHVGVPYFQGLKVSQDERCKRFHKDVHLVMANHARDDLVTDDPSRIAWASNSGFQALNLAFHFGAKRIVLVGVDMRIDLGTHWHGDHPSPLSNPTKASLGRWIAAFEAAAPVFEAHGVEVINASASSHLTGYRKMSLAEAFA